MFNRREFVLGVSGAGVGLSAGPIFGHTGIDLVDRADFLQAAIKMRGSTDERLCIGWVTGTRYAVIEHRAIPMMGLLAATFTQYRQVQPGTYTAKSIEVAYFIDVETRKLIETWRNPFTDRVVDVPKTRMGPSQFTVTADGLQIQRAAGEAVGMELNHHFRPAVVRGDDVWITEVIDVSGTPKGKAAKPFVYNEMTTYQSKLSALANPALATVPTNVSFHGLVTFRPWMGFGDMPGHTTASGGGTRSTSIADLPKYYLELTHEFNPDVLEDPLAVLNADS
ncbi:MAG: DUF1838 family protein [Gammaproteobacteria bacterium]|jgi:hypothetical protein|nr:hypothetical protein [Chromatiales bacterium]MDP6675331.1 DUF1838 family protein [Gammaproteobacteria bacterium]